MNIFDENKIISDLESLTNEIVNESPLPVSVGNSIRIKDYVIRKTQAGFKIYNCSSNEFIASTEYKISALIIVNSLLKGNPKISTVLELDRKLLKHMNDIKFYKHSIKNATNPNLINARFARIVESQISTSMVREELIKYLDI